MEGDGGDIKIKLRGRSYGGNWKRGESWEAPYLAAGLDGSPEEGAGVNGLSEDAVHREGVS